MLQSRSAFRRSQKIGRTHHRHRPGRDVFSPPFSTPSQSLTVTGSIPIGIAALGVHTGAMLATIGLVSIAVYEWIGLALLRSYWINFDLVWIAALSLGGALLLLLG
jgi:hypothetical protein